MYEEAWNSSDNKEYIESPGSFCLCVSQDKKLVDQSIRRPVFGHMLWEGLRRWCETTWMEDCTVSAAQL